MSRNADRALGQLDAMPGGHNALAGGGGFRCMRLLSRSGSVWAQVRAHEEFADPLFEAMSGGQRPRARARLYHMYLHTMQTSPPPLIPGGSSASGGNATAPRAENVKYLQHPPATSEMLPPSRFLRLATKGRLLAGHQLRTQQ